MLQFWCCSRCSCQEPQQLSNSPRSNDLRSQPPRPPPLLFFSSTGPFHLGLWRRTSFSFLFIASLSFPVMYNYKQTLISSLCSYSQIMQTSEGGRHWWRLFIFLIYDKTCFEGWLLNPKKKKTKLFFFSSSKIILLEPVPHKNKLLGLFS